MASVGDPEDQRHMRPLAPLFDRRLCFLFLWIYAYHAGSWWITVHGAIPLARTTWHEYEKTIQDVIFEQQLANAT
jgi:hypothetical protein